MQRWLRIDDTLEVWRAHGVGGLTGALLVGVLASPHINQVSASLAQFGVQLLAVTVVGAYAALVTFGILKGLDRFGTLRVPDAIQEKGLDTMLGERAFNLWNMDRTLPK
ncbi:hypothetical protein GCM10025880_41480 [Methylorubrum aminovorans]|nr:hypothetical protein GCM10025880_41480 [Methylorubrum aminovorans]